ncbi:hypothetical protein [Actinomycetospora endophytica]|nr:hypothetical protein [Actinomycetospora endophytica]
MGLVVPAVAVTVLVDASAWPLVLLAVGALTITADVRRSTFDP